MPIYEANGKKFEFPEGVTQDQVANAIDEYFRGSAKQAPPAEPALKEESILPDMITGNDRQTERSENTDELTAGNLQSLASGEKQGATLADYALGNRPMFEGSQVGQGGGVGGFLSGFVKDLARKLSSSDEEAADIAISQFPNLKKEQDDKGNTYLVNPQSGESIIINKPGVSGADVDSAITQTAAFAAAPGRKFLQAIGQNAAIQGGIEGLQSATGGKFNPEEVALAGGLSGAMRGLEDVAGAGYRAIKGKIAPESQQLISDIEGAGLKARTGDVIPSDTLPGKLSEGVGEANFLTAGGQRSQQEARQEITNRFVSKFEPSYDEIKKSVSDKLGAKFTKSIEYRQLALDKAKNAPVSKEKTLNAIDKELDRLTKTSSGVPLATVDEGAVKALNDYKTDVINASNIDELASLRTNFRDDMSPSFGERSNRKEGAIKRIYGAMTSDMDDTIKPNVTPKEFANYKKGNELYGKTSEEVKKGRIKKILQGGEDLSPEQINNALLNKDSVVRSKFYKSLDENGRQNARAAIIKKLANDSSPDGELSVNQFLNKLKNNNDSINTFFRGKDRKELEGLKNALIATRSAQNAALNPPTGQRLAPYLLGAGAVADLGATIAATLGSAAAYKAYQSKPVRNALLKLANTPKGSSAFETALRQLNQALIPFMQSQTNLD